MQDQGWFPSYRGRCRILWCPQLRRIGLVEVVRDNPPSLDEQPGCGKGRGSGRVANCFAAEALKTPCGAITYKYRGLSGAPILRGQRSGRTVCSSGPISGSGRQAYNYRNEFADLVPLLAAAAT